MIIVWYSHFYLLNETLFIIILLLFSHCFFNVVQINNKIMVIFKCYFSGELIALS